MKKAFLASIFLFSSVLCFAGHIAGGEVYYKYVGQGINANSSVYEISLRLFRECGAGGGSTAAMPTSVTMAIYTNTTPSSLVGSQISVNRTSFQQLQLSTPNPCINNPPTICYQVGEFTFTKELSNTAVGYIVMFQTCCRTNGIDNIQVQTFSNGVTTLNAEGATYTAQIPGTLSLPTGTNSSPVFALKDTTLICQNSPFKLDFSATDPDAGDSLSYSFCAAYDRGQTTGADDINYIPPPYNAVTYATGFSGTTPLGNNVTIDPASGLISGIAPSAGRYVVTVCITEWRNNSPISQHRKDFTLIVNDCTLTGAVLKPTYITCNGTSVSFQNESTSSNITSYLWDFGVPSLTTDTSTSPTPKYDYLQSGKDSGTYSVKLKVTSSGGCQDSTTAQVKVYPGFVPSFNISGSCFYNNYLFKDATTSKYGSVNNWKWDFGDLTTQADTARSKDSAWKYPAPTTVQVKLIVSDDKGCVDTSTQSLTILDKPSLSLPFRDTLICSNDTLALKVNAGSGSTILWQAASGPNQSRILNTGSSSPLVYPQDTTRYYVSVNDNGCANTDSVTVNVLQFITVKAGLDTGICLSDSFRLNPTSDALSYQWTASSGVAVQNTKRPLVQPLVNTRYYVTANLGKCQANDSVLVKVAPYPQANAGADAVICYGSRIQLNAAIVGTSFSWSPTASLINETTLKPVAGPTKTTAYILRVTDTIGCPKPKMDTVLITVIPQIIADAGKDTSVLVNQPLQLNASGGVNYVWTPGTALSNPTIANPVAIFDDKVTDITYTVRVSEGACYSDDQVTVHVYKTGPEILVPSAFTPNGDGKNDVSKPVLLGITKLIYFSIYNRWGQLLFSTNQENKGWDGTFNGVAQPAGTYVYQALGTDYLGNSVYRKGTIVLIR